MRIFLRLRDKDEAEQDNKISKSNYRLYKNYSIEFAILEKRLIYGYSMLSGKRTMHNLTDL
jgi:hypothetical protein